MKFSFDYKEQPFTLAEGACDFFLNDEDRPIEGVDAGKILALMAEAQRVVFDKAYYDQACEICGQNKHEGGRYFEFLEHHFYLFSKEGNYVTSSLSPTYEAGTLNTLLKKGEVDATHIVTVNVCEQCGAYTIDIAYFE